ncbi:uncharacterized protein LOC143226216 isoform X2 [Tachypleus tridentatus]|uniref:uncharacterized protein LOC143226216 isoform X2 n=1 Tax=Tachypleus tridentatus TaxID=6853 RepID=UPI003FCFB9DB
MEFRTLLRIRLSLIFLPPALIYAITSNIFLYALTYVTPAVWIVLIQGKVIFTVAMYRFIFKKPVSKTQWLGAFLIVVAIAFSQLPSIMGTTFPVPVIALLLSMLNSLLAAGVSIYIEVLFKNDNRPFLEQQIQLYFFSTLTSALLSIYCTRLGDVATQWKDLTPRSLILLLLTIVMTSAQGVALASIMQHLDSIVKYYTANIANILTAILSAWCFPDKFSLNWSFGLSLAILVIAIFLYEKNHLNVLVSKHHI